VAATLSDINTWWDRGAADPNYTHMIVVCDTYDWEDYPVYVSKYENVREVHEKHNGKNMQKVMEVYNYALPKEDQVVAGKRVYNF
jgi:hypothetical protein